MNPKFKSGDIVIISRDAKVKIVGLSEFPDGEPVYNIFILTDYWGFGDQDGKYAMRGINYTERHGQLDAESMTLRDIKEFIDDV